MHINSQQTGHESRVTSQGDEINLLDYWRIILKYRKMIVAALVVTSVSAVVVSLLLPKSYRAEALIIPISSKGGSGGLGALSSQFGGLASLAGVSLPGGAGEVEKIMAILKSRTLTENVINNEDLMPILFYKSWDPENKRWRTADPKKTPNMEIAVRLMRSSIVIMEDKKSKTIKISGAFRDPQLAARVVNAYIAELQKFINSNALTMAKRNRFFIEGQLEENKEDLLEAGKEINEFYSGKRVSSAEAKVDVPIASASEPETRDSEPVPHNPAPVDPGSRFPNPVIATAEAGTLLVAPELSSLMIQKNDIEKKIAEARTVKNVPQQVYLTYLMLRRELLAKVNALLTSQYEMAKIEESKEELSFQIIDKAVPPMYKFKPKRAQICIMAFMAALFGAVFLAFLREYIERMKKMQVKG